MRLGLISDIHGNSDALAAVLAALRADGVDRLICCGDIVGYYYAPAECLEQLAEWNVTYVRGNHEDMLAAVLSDPSAEEPIRQKYGSGLRVACESLPPDRLQRLINLPSVIDTEIEGRRVVIGHGAPWDVNQYIYPDAPHELLVRCAHNAPDYVVLGHTHYPMCHRIDDTVIINPGSVGQARGAARGRAQWAVLDLERGDVRHESITYDTSRLLAEATHRDPEVTYLRSALLPAGPQ